MGPLIAGLLAVVAGSAFAQTPATPRAFIDRVDSRYTEEATRNLDLVTGKDAARIFAPSLLDLFWRDQRRAGPGYVGYLDYDPVRGCQDADGIRIVRSK